MFKFWKPLSYTTKFSVIGFILTFGLGLITMGLLGAGLYYSVAFLFISYPTLNDWHGDWVWPNMILSGMAWSFGFLFGGLAWHYIYRWITYKPLLRAIYVLILWLWAAFIWYIIIKNNLSA